MTKPKRVRRCRRKGCTKPVKPGRVLCSRECNTAEAKVRLQVVTPWFAAATERSLRR